MILASISSEFLHKVNDQPNLPRKQNKPITSNNNKTQYSENYCYIIF